MMGINYKVGFVAIKKDEQGQVVKGAKKNNGFKTRPTGIGTRLKENNGVSKNGIKEFREKLIVKLDTHDAQFGTSTPYSHSCYGYKWESFPSKFKKMLVKFDIWKWPKRIKTCQSMCGGVANNVIFATTIVPKSKVHVKEVKKDKVEVKENNKHGIYGVLFLLELTGSAVLDLGTRLVELSSTQTGGHKVINHYKLTNQPCLPPNSDQHITYTLTITHLRITSWLKVCAIKMDS